MVAKSTAFCDRARLAVFADISSGSRHVRATSAAGEHRWLSCVLFRIQHHVVGIRLVGHVFRVFPHRMSRAFS